ncbi:hypothetical protein DUG12_24725 [Salmonella enterica]|nr:hypothetical protein [Salmonella enterica]
MNIKQITDEAEKSITEDMQKAIDAKDQWQAEMFFNWAVGTLNFWRRLASFIVRQESDLSKSGQFIIRVICWHKILRD